MFKTYKEERNNTQKNCAFLVNNAQRPNYDKIHSNSSTQQYGPSQLSEMFSIDQIP